MQLNKLKAKMVEKGINADLLADVIGVDRSSMYRKMNNFDKITIGEAKLIKAALEMSDEDAIAIFLS